MRLFWRKTKPVQNPTEGFARMMLEQALQKSAKAIVFGVPRGMQCDMDEAKGQHDAMLRTVTVPGQGKLTEDDLSFVSRCATLRYRNGYSCIPAWFGVNGAFEPALPMPGGVFVLLLHTLSSMPVSLGATPEVHQPMRYIELQSEDPGKRRFVEIELIMEEDNTIRVELLGVRVEERGIRVSPVADGSQPAEPLS